MKYIKSKPTMELSKVELQTIFNFIQALDSFCRDNASHEYSLFDVFEEIEELYATLVTDGDFSPCEDDIFNYNITD